MSDEFDFSTGMPSEEMASYLQMCLDETAEQLDALVETLLVLEGNPTDKDQLHEAFRLIHSIKGSSAMMGLDSITVLTHHLENHFERLRSGLQMLDQVMMDLILRCIDFLRDCNQRLRAGESLASAPELLDQLMQLNSTENSFSKSPKTVPPAASNPANPTRHYHLLVRLQAGLPLVDLKAELILAKLEEVGQVRETVPHRDNLSQLSDENLLQIIVSTDKASTDLMVLADIGGVEHVEVHEHVESAARTISVEARPGDQKAVTPIPTPVTAPESVSVTDTMVPAVPVAEVVPITNKPAVETNSPSILTEKRPEQPVVLEEMSPVTTTPVPVSEVSAVAATPQVVEECVTPELTDNTVNSEFHSEEVMTDDTNATASSGDVSESKSRVVETVRVDIERLDNLMNLAGELVVNKARFVQIARQMSPAFKKSSVSGRARAFSESMRRALQMMKSQSGFDDSQFAAQWNEHCHDLESEIEVIEEQSKLWEESRRYFGQISEAIDQLARVSDSLQRGVLDTRMVPVAPLSNRFKRVVRDISHELKKKVNLEIRGEKTELDKRMIDELGDPLVHLVRNAIDHGIESSEVRLQSGKSEAGTVLLEAAHSGNNVFISVSDDGGGINTAKVRKRIVERGLLPESAVESLTDHEVIEYIWHPGFSTADVISDISGRGVGMDIVKTRIAELNGTIGIENLPGQGTKFTIRLPLTLAIIRSLLFHLRHGIFAVPIDNVREIVSVPVNEIVTILGKQTFEVRGEFIPLVDIDDVFDWHAVQYGNVVQTALSDAPSKRVDVVILHNANKTMGLKVDELYGGQDIVIKSLAENFVHIRGLSGASILGDGSVCLLLDVGAAIDMAVDTHVGRRSRERQLVLA